MVFSGITFLFYFLPIVLLLYFLVPSSLQNLVLFISSLFFYAWGEPRYVFLLLVSSLMNFQFGQLLYQHIQANRHINTTIHPTAVSSNISFYITPRTMFCCFLGINLFMLFLFKYSNLPLPIGISFYTFQVISYLIDVYRGTVLPAPNFLSFGTYVMLFPQLIAGPVVRYATVEKELISRSSDYRNGVTLFIIGLAQKILLANPVGAIFEETLNTTLCKSTLPDSALSTGTAWISLLAYAFQIYFDFCGYSYMAIGLGKIFGFHFPTNFNYPYISKSITEFWSRWHISLSSWFKEYVYIPLGGNQHGLLIQLRNICIVWMLTGIWHGATWNFLLWGIYFAFLLILEKLFLKKLLSQLPRILQHFYAIFTILMGWLLFAFDSVSDLRAYYHSLFQFRVLSDSRFFYILHHERVLLLLCLFFSTPLPTFLYQYCTEKIKSYNTYKKCCFLRFSCLFTQALALLFLLLLSVSYMVDASYNPFLYFRF